MRSLFTFVSGTIFASTWNNGCEAVLVKIDDERVKLISVSNDLLKSPDVHVNNSWYADRGWTLDWTPVFEP